MFTCAGMKALHAWTHESLDLLFDHAATLPAELFVRQMEGFGRPSVRDQLVHTLACERLWVCNLQNQVPMRLKPQQFASVDALRDLKRQVMAETLRYLERLGDAQLNTPLREHPQDWGGPLRSPAYILQHVLTHAFHHKGQVVAMCRLLAHPAPDTDLQRV